MQADSWCPLCGADRAVVAWCPRCANALGIEQPVHEDDFPQGNKQQSAGDPTRFLLGTATGGLQSPSHKGSPKNLASKNTPAKKSGAENLAPKNSGPKAVPHGIKPSVLRHREKMREYMRRRREAARKAARNIVDPNIIHPGVADANPSPEENE